MAGKRKVLSGAQLASLANIRKAKRNLTDARADAEARIRQAMAEELGLLESAYALEIRHARNLGVPISTIGTEGMGSRDPYTVRRWLEKTADLEETREVSPDLSAPAGVFKWVDDGKAVDVEFEGFPTTINADDYPQVLTGRVKRSKKAANGWEVVTDPGTTETAAGPLVGWFTIEVTDIPKGAPGSLTAMLDAWAEANS
jgi:hypothetical protein